MSFRSASSVPKLRHRGLESNEDLHLLLVVLWQFISYFCGVLIGILAVNVADHSSLMIRNALIAAGKPM